MARIVSLPRGFEAKVADEWDLTVKDQWDLEHSGIRAEAVQAKAVTLQLEELKKLEANLTIRDRELETAYRLGADDQSAPLEDRELARVRLDRLLEARRDIALSIAFDRIPADEYEAVDHGEVWRVLCFLRSWDVTDEDGELLAVPTRQERSTELVREISMSWPSDCLKAVLEATKTVRTSPTNFDRTPEAMLPKASTGPIADSGATPSPEALSGTTKDGSSSSTQPPKRSSRTTKS